jgi:hypothetical protein
MAGKGASFTLIKKPHVRKVYKIIQDKTAKSIKPVAKKHVAARKGVVSDWVNQPVFGYRITVKPRKIQMTIFVRNASQKLTNSDATMGDLWRWIDIEGTKAHPIEAVKAPTLAFRKNYSSRTKARPARAHTGSGKSFGPSRFPKKVNHPGYTARKFWKKFDKEYRKDFIAAVKKVKVGRRI